MKVTIKLFASFQKGRFVVEARDVPPATTVAAIVADIQIPEAQIGVLMANGRHVDLDHSLGEGDVLAIFPVIGGG